LEAQTGILGIEWAGEHSAQSLKRPRGEELLRLIRNQKHSAQGLETPRGLVVDL
jgi:hypothetical protein